MKINRYTETIIKARATPDLVDRGAIMSAGSTAGMIAAGAGFGADYLQKKEDAETRTWLNKAIIETQKEAYIRSDKYKANPNAEYKNFADTFKTDFTKFRDDYSKTAPSEDAKQAYAEAMERYDFEVYKDNKSWENRRQIEVMGENIKTSAKDLKELAASNVYAGRSNADLYKHVDAATIAAKDVYSDDQLFQLNKEMYQGIQRAELDALVDVNPQELKRQTTVGKYSPGDIDFDKAVEEVMRLEGGFVANDAGKGETLYGINSSANPKDYKELKALYDAGDEEAAQAKAKEIYKNKYWNDIGADDLPAEIRLAAFDAAVNQGQGAAKEMIKMSDGDPQKFNQLRKERYEAIAKNNPDKAQFLDAWLKRTDETGSVGRSDLPADELMDYRIKADAAIARQEAEQNKVMSQEQTLADSRVNIAIATAKTPQEMTAVSNEIDQLEPALGEEWANKNRLQLFNANKEYIKKQESAALGANFATGKAQANPANTEHVKAADEFYKSVLESKDFAEADPVNKSLIVSNMVKNTRMIPSTLKGEIQSVSRGYDTEAITQTANLVESIKVTSPYLLPELGTEQDLRRLSMINSRMSVGVPAEQAIKKVDEILDPQNKPAEDQIAKEIKDAKIDFRQQTVQSFTGFFEFSPETEAPAEAAQIDNASLEYQIAYEDAYRATRDHEQAAKEASDKMSLWGKTTLNPNKMIMKFPPENYYQIENQSPDWIREQAIEDIYDLQKGGLGARDKDYISENLYIVPHPKYTPETAVSGEPEYAIIMMMDGTPVNVLGNKTWKPDVQKKREQLVRGK